MKFGIREIANVVFKAKGTQKVGNRIFYKDEPVMYFDTLKTSSLEGAADTVYATGGRGNPRLIGWDGNRTMTFNMEDALISAEGLMILTGAGLIEASTTDTIKVHTTEQTTVNDDGKVTLSNIAYIPATGAARTEEDWIYVMKLDANGDVNSEPYICTATTTGGKTVLTFNEDDEDAPKAGEIVLVDYYVERNANTKQIEITADKFGGNYYIEAETLFRNTDGVDLPAEFVIPNAKIQSNFTFSMAAEGDPSEQKRLAA